jgi:hypothetical protein
LEVREVRALDGVVTVETEKRGIRVPSEAR